MVVKEELRPLISVTDRLYRCKTRLKQMRRMRNQRVGFERIEKFLRDLNGQKKSSTCQGFRESKVVENLMDIKLRDERKLHNTLKREHEELTSLIIRPLEKGSRRQQEIKRHLRWVGYNARNSTEEKFGKKIERLKAKHKTEERKNRMRELPTSWRNRFPNLNIYRELDGEPPPAPKPPEEPLSIGDFVFKQCEKTLLRFPPKTTVERDFCLKTFENDNQQLGCKLRWEAQRLEGFMEEQNHLPEEQIR